MKNRTVNFTEGKLLPAIIAYTIPLVLASLIQMLFNVADFSILGNFDTSPDSSATGAVGATGALVNLLVSSVIGLSQGTNVLLARAVGAKENDRARKIVSTTMILSAVSSIVVLLFGFATIAWFLRITGCPQNCYDGALTYMRIYFLAAPAIYVYNFGSAIIRVSGDSRSPFYYILASGLLNVALNFVLCVVMEDKVAAVAIATLVSNLLGAVLTVRHLLCMEAGPCKVEFRKMEFSWRELGNIFVLGLPTAFTSALYGISDLQMQSAINSFGSSVVAGNSASAKLDGFVNSFTYPIAASAMGFVGQNLGAEEKERVKKSIVICLLLSFSVALILGNGALLISDPIIRTLLPNDPIGIEVAKVRIEWVLSLYFICAIDSVLSFSMRAFGYPILPMINSLVSVILLRAAWMAWIYPNMPVSGNAATDIMNVYKCYMVSWVLSLLVQIILFAVVYSRYLKGKGKKI